MDISNVNGVQSEVKFVPQGSFSGAVEKDVVKEIPKEVPVMQKPAAEYKGMEAKEKIDDKMMEKSLEQANKSLEVANRYIEREVHEKTHAVMYKLKDRTTGEVIAEFPPKKIQDMIAKMWELAGLFVDEKA